MANDFTRADCKAAWQFESSPGFLKDTKTIQPDFTNTNVTEDTTNYMEGSRCGSYAGTQFLAITDANLAAGFPFKSGDTTKLMTLSAWVRPTTVDANKRVIAAKWRATGNLRGWSLSHNSTAIYLDYSNNGTTVQTAISFLNPMTANQKYFICLTIDAVMNLYWFRIYSVTAGTWAAIEAGGLATTVFAGGADFQLGWSDAQVANCSFIGQIDEVLMFNSRLHHSETVAIKDGNFPVTGYNIYDFCYNPTVADDNQNGFATAALAFKTMKHNFYPGDIINAAKSGETAKSGTATATNGSVSVTGISGWTPATYDIIRFDSEPTIYMIRSFAGSTITLWRCYRGTTGSGKVISTLGSIQIASQDMNSTSLTGSPTANIIFNGGVDLSTMTQNGFTILNPPGAAYAWYNSSPQNWTYNNLGFYNWTSVWGVTGAGCQLTGCTFNRLFLFKNESNLGTFWNCVFNNGPIAEGGTNQWPCMSLFYCIVNDPETAQVGSGWYQFGAIDTLVYRWKNASDANNNAINIATPAEIWGLRFIDPVFDEQSKGCKNINLASGSINLIDVIFENPIIATGTPFTITSGASLITGELDLVNVNGVPTDHRAYFPLPYATTFVLVTPDASTYNTVGPSVKVTLPGGGMFSPFYQRHYIPCDANVEKTISAYMRHNASYAVTATQTPWQQTPWMRIRWTTGTSPNLVHNVYDVPMTDVNDTWELVSHAITPTIQGSIIVEFYFNSGNSGAIGWYDDLVVT